MAVRPDRKLDNAFLKTVKCASGQTITAGKAVRFVTDDTTMQDAAAGENADAIALETASAGNYAQVALLAGSQIIPVLVGTGGATRSSFATVVSDGVTNITLGGGTTVKYVQGWFTQSGVAGDIVGLVPNKFAGVAS